nr:MAG TPA: hypothetical protein [Caudoviricetes sp.]
MLLSFYITTLIIFYIALSVVSILKAIFLLHDVDFFTLLCII